LWEDVANSSSTHSGSAVAARSPPALATTQILALAADPVLTRGETPRSRAADRGQSPAGAARRARLDAGVLRRTTSGALVTTRNSSGVVLRARPSWRRAPQPVTSSEPAGQSDEKQGGTHGAPNSCAPSI
jgi:hypothetical protein